MESGPNNAPLYCLTIAFVGALLGFALGTPENLSRGDRYHLLLFFVWATYIPWMIALVVLISRQPRRPPPPQP